MKWPERIFWIAAIVILFFFLRSCGQGLGIFKSKPRLNDTISVKIDTQYVEIKVDTLYVPEIIGVTNTIYQPKYIHDTVETLEVRIDPADTAAILARFYERVAYEDIQPIQKDTFFYGTVTIRDSVSENRIFSRRFITNLQIPEKTTTITLRDRRTVGYIGFSAIGNPNTPLYSVGADFSLKLKNDKIYGLGVQYTKDRVVYYQGQFKLPIRFGKK